MEGHKVGFSTCTIVRDAISVGLPVFENVASWLPFASECLVVDFGSTDGTRELLAEIEAANPTLKVLDCKVDPNRGAAITADTMTFGLKQAKNTTIITSSADEVYHEKLVSRTLELLEARAKYIYYPAWRQITKNFQEFKAFTVERISCVQRDEVVYTADGAYPEPDPPDRVPGLVWQKNYAMTNWWKYWLKPENAGNDYYVLDVSGCFRDNMAARYHAHRLLWKDNPLLLSYGGRRLTPEEWQEELKKDPAWEAKTSPYESILPSLLKGLVGMTKYTVRSSLIEAMKEGRPYHEA